MSFKSLFVAVLAGTVALCGCRRTEVTVDVADFLPQYTFGDDATLAFRRAVEACRERKASKLVVPAGTYHFYPQFAFEKYCYVSNNSAGLKRFVFDLTGLENFLLDAQGAEFVFHGYVSAFTIDSCRNVEIRDFSMDYARTFHSEGRIERSGDGWADLRFPADYRYEIRNGDLHFSDEAGNDYPFSHLLEFDAERREPEFHASDYWLTDRTIPAEQRSDGSVRIFKKGLTAHPGNILVLGPAHRLCPAVAISDSRGVLLRDLNIYHCGGMGVVAQRSGDIELNGVRIEPAPGSGRMISITADATHFSHCDGYVRMIGCRFFNQIDDATNIHGMYGVVERVLAPDRILLFFPHEQQYGLDVIRPGARVEMLRRMSLLTYDEIGVKEVRRLNKERYEVVFDRPMAGEAGAGDLLTEMRYPEVLIKGCRMGNNRARGLLLGSRKRTVVEECYFHIPGSAIYFEGDGYYWYEQAGVRDVVIRNNVFDNCNYGYRNWGTACIAVGSGPREDRAASMYNRNIRIENNTFRVFDPRILNFYSVDGCVFRNNRIERTADYPASNEACPPFVMSDCAHLDIEGYNTADEALN